jgi:tRNA modification GTPase
MSMTLETDTIVARATGPGAGALALIRLSGPGAGAILQALTPGRESLPAPRRATVAELHDPGSGRLLDQAVVTLFPSPGSYTGEDVVEISCHGGPVVVGSVEEACRRLGARRAEAGEFTRRAFLNGRMDLLQAEAVADLVDGRNPAQQDIAVHQLQRGLSRRIAELRGELLRVEALLVQHLDFPDEDEPPVPVERIAAALDGVVASLDDLLGTAPGGVLLREGALVVLAGRPNAGKSSLFNALLGEERAIVTDEPGTTRDALEVPVSLGGYPFRLVDTAGLREGGGRVERLGIEVAHRYLARADVVLFCLESGRLPDPEERAFLEGRGADGVIVARTKADLVGEGGWEGPGVGFAPGISSLPVSSETGAGLAALMEGLRDRVYGALSVARRREAPVVTRERQVAALRVARVEVAAFADGLRAGLPPEVVSSHLRTAETALEEVVGVIHGDEVLDMVFREFCIGK